MPESPNVLLPSPARSDTRPGRDCIREACAALKFWEALEYLAPQAPPAVRADQLAWALPDRSDAELPWHDPIKGALLAKEHGQHWRCQIFAGIIEGTYLVETARRFLDAPTLDLSERPPPAGAACVVVATDCKGYLAWPVFVSSLPWALARLRDGAGKPEPLEFAGFFGLGGAEERMRNAILDLMFERRVLAPPPPPDPDDPRPPVPIPLRPVTMADVDAVVQRVFDVCDFHPAQELPWRVKGRHAPDKEEDPREQDDPLNSFIAEDLERVGHALAAGEAGAGLQAYLRGEETAGRIDLEQRRDALLAGVVPERLPPACWPAPKPLVTAQQFAVNTALRGLAEAPGIFSVNGPPGTGKTTMLKDIVAAVVVQRADALARIADPLAAFATRLEIDQYSFKAFRPDPALAGFGIVVASANNGAVENITKELPALSELADGYAIDYFPEVADSVAAPPKATQVPEQRQRWGLVTAVLGSKEKRREFARRFWLAGMAPPKPGEPAQAPDPLRLRSLQELFKTGEHRAMSWQEARDRYQAARARVDEELAAAAALAGAVAERHDATAQREGAARALAAADGELAQRQARVQDLGRQAADGAQRITAARQRLGGVQAWEKARHAVAAAENELAALVRACPDDTVATSENERALAEGAVRELRDEQESHQRHRPGFFAQLFRTEYSRRWNARDAEFDRERAQAKARLGAANVALASALQRAGVVARAREKLAGLLECAAAAEAAAHAAGARPTDTAADLQRALDSSIAESARARAALASEERELATVTAQRVSLLAAADDAARRIAAATALLASSGLDDAAMKKWDLTELDRAALHRTAPYFTPALFAARRALFVAAMDLHKSFIAASWHRLKPTLAAFVNVLKGDLHPSQVRDGVRHLWDAFFLVVPVVSTTFASFARLFTGMPPEALAWLLIDEAGQATPQLAAGAIWRSQRTLLVGDPLQLEPVVGVPDELIEPLLERCGAERQWAPPEASAQTLADKTNRYGVLLRQRDDASIWLGSPLVVHRRCLDPMFSISNSIAYDNKMVFDVAADSGGAGIGPSRWIDMPAGATQGHWSESQAHMTLRLVEEITGGALRNADGKLRVYVITPFRTVEEKMKTLLARHHGDKADGMVGTVHKFQGKEAEHVVFLLGGDPRSPGAIANYAGAKPNLVNVAVTRAKRRLYVIGDLQHWTGPADMHGFYRRLAALLEVERPVDAA